MTKTQEMEDLTAGIILDEYESLYRMAYTYVHNESNAMDIVQESAYKAITKCQTGKPRLVKKSLKLSSLFQKNADYRAVISKEIRRQMKKQMKADPSKSYFIDTKKDDVPVDEFKKISASENFYLTSSGDLVIVFDKYEVAPGYMGAPEFTISKKLLSSILR